MKKGKRPHSFSTPEECIRWIKKSVYLVARGRLSEDKKQINWRTLGSCFLVAPNRIATAAHVIDNPQEESMDMEHHKKDDLYYLIKHDDEGNYHATIINNLEININLFLYPKIDLGIIYLEDSFYQKDERIFALKDDYIRVQQKFKSIGTEIAILGYPLSGLTFEESDSTKPKVGNILLRADSGIINCRYQTDESTHIYEFTVAFNPGNSGGPIFDFRTGQLLSIVHGYKAIPIRIKETMLSDEDKRNIKIQQYKENSYIDVVHANYSIGYSTASFIYIFKQHNIIS